jgi:hypothetical protein
MAALKRKIMKTELIIPIYQRRLEVSDSLEDTIAVGEVSDNDGEIFFSFKRGKKFGGAALAHECLHIANRVFRICGVKSDEWNDEHCAYMVQWLYLELFDFIFRPKKFEKTAHNKRNKKCLD